MQTKESTKVFQIKRYAPDLQIAMGVSSLGVTLENEYVVLTMSSGLNDVIRYGSLIESQEYRSAKGLVMPTGQTTAHKMIDEMADLMLNGRKCAETPIVRLAQKANAWGMHLILAAQRPTSDIVIWLIKADIPTRICIAVKSYADSMVEIDQKGGEKLLGSCDTLFIPNGQINPQRLFTGYVMSTERDNIIYLLRQVGY